MAVFKAELEGKTIYAKDRLKGWEDSRGNKLNFVRGDKIGIATGYIEHISSGTIQVNDQEVIDMNSVNCQITLKDGNTAWLPMDYLSTSGFSVSKWLFLVAIVAVVAGIIIIKKKK